MFFPSIDCITLPPPSEDAAVMQNIVASEDQLSPHFTAAVPKVIDHIISKVKPNTGYTTGKKEDGTGASLLEEGIVLHGRVTEQSSEK